MQMPNSLKWLAHTSKCVVKDRAIKKQIFHAQMHINTSTAQQHHFRYENKICNDINSHWDMHAYILMLETHTARELVMKGRGNSYEYRGNDVNMC